MAGLMLSSHSSVGGGSMDSNQKKVLIKKRIAEGDKRSYNEIAADLELQLWTEEHKGNHMGNMIGK